MPWRAEGSWTALGLEWLPWSRGSQASRHPGRQPLIGPDGAAPGPLQPELRAWAVAVVGPGAFALGTDTRCGLAPVSSALSLGRQVTSHSCEN